MMFGAAKKKAAKPGVSFAVMIGGKGTDKGAYKNDEAEEEGGEEAGTSEKAEMAAIETVVKAMGGKPEDVDMGALREGLKGFLEACYPGLAEMHEE